MRHEQHTQRRAVAAHQRIFVTTFVVGSLAKLCALSVSSFSLTEFARVLTEAQRGEYTETHREFEAATHPEARGERWPF